MDRRLVVPLLFAAAVLTVFLQAIVTFFPILMDALSDPIAPGQALKACLFWSFAHLGIPSLGAIAGAWIAFLVARRINSGRENSDK